VKIREQDKQAILNIAKDTVKEPSKILAFGSRVDGSAHDTSDLDLVIISDKNKKIEINNLVEFKERLKKSNIPISVQVLDWYRIPESFHKNILKKYEELQ
jgi:predicted nucleotidyltransferase